MSDHSHDRTGHDCDCIDLSDDNERRYWCQKFGVGADLLQHAVRQAGPMVKDVRKWFSHFV